MTEQEQTLEDLNNLIKIQSMTIAAILNWIYSNQAKWQELGIEPPADVIGLVRHIIKGEETSSTKQENE